MKKKLTLNKATVKQLKVKSTIKAGATQRCGNQASIDNGACTYGCPV